LKTLFIGVILASYSTWCNELIGSQWRNALLSAPAETPGPVIDNLEKAEKFGWIESTEGWMAMRRLRNQMVHEYIEDLTVLCSALRSAHAFVPTLVVAARRCVAEGKRIGVIQE